MKQALAYVSALVAVFALAGCQKGHPVWTTLTVRDAATKEAAPESLLAIGPQTPKDRGTRAAVRADESGSARLMIEQGAVDYRVSVRVDQVTEHVDLPRLVESFDDDAWRPTEPTGAFEVRLKRDEKASDPFAGLGAEE